MKLNIFGKLFLGSFLTTLILVVAVMASVRWSFLRGFEEYLFKVQENRLDRFASLLAQQYQQHGSWSFLSNDESYWIELLQQGSGVDSEGEERPLPPPELEFGAGPGLFMPPPQGHPHPPPRVGLLRDGHVWVLDTDRVQVAGPPFPLRDVAEASLRPIVLNHATVGWLGFRPHPHARPLRDDRIKDAFIEQQSRTGYVIMAFALAISLLGSWVLARQFLSPIRRLAAGANALRAGRYETEVAVTGDDELGGLATDFNLLARTLFRNEQSRRQWVADTSHELRTPLAVLRSEVEALQDGIREPTPERLNSLHGEIMALSKMVDDLFELSLYDLGSLKYRMEPLSPADIVEDVASGFQGRFEERGIDLRRSYSDLPKIAVMGDSHRLRQLFGNLLENSLRYTYAGGICEIAVSKTDTLAVLEFRDSAPGVPGESCERLFERFFRADSSRSRSLGGAGLGLAICRNIVEAHGGGIRAQASHLGGLRVRVELPLLSS